MAALLPYYGALIAGVLLGVAGQILLKAGATRSADVMTQFVNPFTILGFGTYAIAAAFYVIAIKKLPLSVAFPSVSLSYIVVAILAHLFWDEPLGPAQFAGIAFIAGGILLLNRV